MCYIVHVTSLRFEDVSFDISKVDDLVFDKMLLWWLV
jgi:hypothetical protein